MCNLYKSVVKLNKIYPNNCKKETHHEMKIPERDVTYIALFVYLLTLTSFIRHKMDYTQVNYSSFHSTENI